MKYLKSYENTTEEEEFNVGDYVEYINIYVNINLPWFIITEIDNDVMFYKYKIMRIDNKGPYKEMWVQKQDLKKVPDYVVAAKKYNIG